MYQLVLKWPELNGKRYIKVDMHYLCTGLFFEILRIWCKIQTKYQYIASLINQSINSYHSLPFIIFQMF